MGGRAGWVIAPIVVGPELLGYLVMVDGADAVAGDELDLLAIQHAATVYAIALMHERLAMDVTNRWGELIEALLLGQATDAQRVRERAVRLGYDLQRTYRVLALVPDGLAGFDRRARARRRAGRAGPCGGASSPSWLSLLASRARARDCRGPRGRGRAAGAGAAGPATRARPSTRVS